MSLKTAFHSRLEFLFRPAQDAEFDWAYALFRRVNYDLVRDLAGEWPEQFQSDFFRNGFSTVRPNIIENHEGDRLGMFALHRTPERLMIKHLHIDTPHQGQGIGSAVLELALSCAHQQVLPLELEVLENNARAIGLYQNRGYIKSGEILVYDWVREIPMRQKETWQYSPKTAIEPSVDLPDGLA